MFFPFPNFPLYLESERITLPLRMFSLLTTHTNNVSSSRIVQQLVLRIAFKRYKNHGWGFVHESFCCYLESTPTPMPVLGVASLRQSPKTDTAERRHCRPRSCAVADLHIRVFKSVQVYDLNSDHNPQSNHQKSTRIGGWHCQLGAITGPPREQGELHWHVKIL